MQGATLILNHASSHTYPATLDEIWEESLPCYCYTLTPSYSYSTSYNQDDKPSSSSRIILIYDDRCPGIASINNLHWTKWHKYFPWKFSMGYGTDEYPGVRASNTYKKK